MADLARRVRKDPGLVPDRARTNDEFDVGGATTSTRRSLAQSSRSWVECEESPGRVPHDEQVSRPLVRRQIKGRDRRKRSPAHRPQLDTGLCLEGQAS
jgi:hypothetical protein